MSALEVFRQNHPLLQNLPSTNDDIYFTEEFFHQLQPHIPLLLKSNKITSITVDPSHIDLYSGDFYGYLHRYHKPVPYELYWLSCRMSGMNGPNDFDKRYQYIYVVTDISIINKIAITKKAIQKSAI